MVRWENEVIGEKLLGATDWPVIEPSLHMARPINNKTEKIFGIQFENKTNRM